MKIPGVSGTKILLGFLSVMMLVPSVRAATITTAGDGNWSSTTPNAPWPGGIVPSAGDDVVIRPGDDLTVTTDAAINSIAFNNTSATAASLSVNAGVILTVASGVTLRNSATTATAATLAGAGTINCGSLTVGGTTAVTGGDNAVAALTTTISNLSVSGNLSVTGTDNGGTDRFATFSLNAGSVSVGGTVVLSSPGGVTALLTMASGAQTGTLTLLGETPITNTGAGTQTFTLSGAGATVIYSGADQPVFTTAYRNLTISGTGVKTLAADLSVAGICLVSSGARLDCDDHLISGGTFTLSSNATLGIGHATGIASSGNAGNIRTTTRNYNAAANYLYNGTVAQGTGTGFPAALSGTLTIANGVGTGVTLSQSTTLNSPGAAMVNSGGLLTLGSSVLLTGSGDFNLDAGGTLAIASAAGITASSAVGNVQTAGRSFSPGANYVYNGVAAQVTGDGLPANVNSLTVANAAGLAVSQSVGVTSNLVLTTGAVGSAANLALGTGATISRVGGSLSGTPTFGAAVNLIYTGATAVTTGTEVPAAAPVLVDLTVANTAVGGVTLNSPVEVNGSLTIGTGATLNVGVGNQGIGISGNWTNNGTFTKQAGTVTFKGSGDQMITGSATTAFHHFTINKPGGVLTGPVVMNISGDWTHLAGTYDPANGTVTLNGTTGIQAVHGNTTFHHLTIANAGATANLGASAITIGGTLSKTSGNLMEPGLSTVTFTGAASSLAGGNAKVFYNLVIASGATVTQGASAGNLTIQHDFTNEGTFNQNSALSTTFDNSSNVHVLSGGGSTTFGDVSIGGATLLQAQTSFAIGGDSFAVTGSLACMSGTVTFNAVIALTGSGAFGFNHVIFNAAATLNAAGTYSFQNVTINSPNGALTSTSGSIDVGGDWVNNDTFTHGGGTVRLNGLSGAQSLGGSQPTAFNNLSIYLPDGVVTLAADISVASVLNLQAGELNAANRTITLSGTGSPLVVAGTFVPATSTVVYSSGAGATVRGGNYHSLTVNSSGDTFVPANHLTLSGNLTIGTGTIFDASTTNNSVSLAGNWTNHGTFAPRAGSVTFTGSGAQTLAGTVGAQSFYDFIVNKPAGTLTVGGSTTTLSVTNDLTLVAGTFAAGTATTINLLGDWLNDGGSFTPGTGTVNFNNATAAQMIGGTAPSQTFNNLTVSKASQTLSVAGGTTNLVVGNYTNTSGNFTAPAALDVAGHVTLTAGTFTAGDAITVAGNWTRATAATFVPGSSVVTFDGGAAQTIGGTATSQTFNHVTVNKGNTLSVGGSTVTLTVNDLTQTLGNLTAPTTLNINGDFVHAAGTFTSGTSVNVAGDWTRNGGTFMPASGTVTFNSSSAAQAINGSLATQNFNSLTVNKSGQNLSVATATLDIGGNVTLTDGTFTAGTTMNVASNWTRALAASFVPGTGTVIFDNPANAIQVIGGTATNQTFHNLVVRKTGANDLTAVGLTNLTLNDFTQTSGDFTAPATLTLGGNFLHTAGNFTAGANLNIAGNWTNNANGFAAGANVTFNGTTQAIAGATSTTFNSLNIASPSETRLFTAATATLCTVSNGATLGGTANLTGPTVVNGAVAPGNTIGRWTTGRETWNGGGAYVWEINDATGAPGTGWDLLSLTTGQGVNLQATAGNQFTLKLATRNGSAPGVAANFNNAITNNWIITIATNATITNFSADRFVIDAGAFSNNLAGGSFSILMPTSTNLVLRFTPNLNPPPVASSASFNCTPGLSVAIQITGAGGLASDPNGDPLTVTTTTPTKGDVFVIPIGADYYLYYLNNGSTGADSFNYTVDDGSGGTATATISLTIGEPNGVSQNQLTIEPLGGGQVRLRFLGIPGDEYALEATTDTVAPFTWTELMSTTTDATGLIEFVVTPAGSPTFFRTRWVP